MAKRGASAVSVTGPPDLCPADLRRPRAGLLVVAVSIVPRNATEDLIPVNNPLERILREIRRRTRVVGAFPDGQSALNLAAARLRHIAGTAWSTKRYLNIELLKERRSRT